LLQNEVDGINVALQSLGRSSSLEDGKWTRHFKEMCERSPRDTFVKGVLNTFEGDAKFGRSPTDQEVEERLFRLALYLDAKAAATRAKEGAARARQPPREHGKSTKPGPPKDQRPGMLKRANFTSRPVLASDLSETAHTQVLHLGHCFKCF